MATTGVANSAKVEMLSGIHCLNATLTAITATANTTALVTAMASTAGIVVGMAVTGTAVAANTFVSNITSATTLTLSVATTGANSTLTFTGDLFKLLLIRVSPVRTFDNTQSNIGTPGTSAASVTNVGVDEVTAGGAYVSGGVALTNITPALNGNPVTTASTSFATVNWTSATIATTAAIIYNTSTRGGAAATPLNNRCLEVLDFGGTNQVTNGTLTLAFPTNDGSSAVLRIA